MSQKKIKISLGEFPFPPFKLMSEEEIKNCRNNIENDLYYCETCDSPITISAFGHKIEDGGIYTRDPYFRTRNGHVDGFICKLRVRYVKSNPNDKSKTLEEAFYDALNAIKKKNNKNDLKSMKLKGKSSTMAETNNSNSLRTRTNNEKGKVYNNQKTIRVLKLPKSSFEIENNRNYKYTEPLQSNIIDGNLEIYNIIKEGKLIVKNYNGYSFNNVSSVMVFKSENPYIEGKDLIINENEFMIKSLDYIDIYSGKLITKGYNLFKFSGKINNIVEYKNKNIYISLFYDDFNNNVRMRFPYSPELLNLKLSKFNITAFGEARSTDSKINKGTDIIVNDKNDFNISEID